MADIQYTVNKLFIFDDLVNLFKFMKDYQIYNKFLDFQIKGQKISDLEVSIIDLHNFNIYEYKVLFIELLNLPINACNLNNETTSSLFDDLLYATIPFQDKDSQKYKLAMTLSKYIGSDINNVKPHISIFEDIWNDGLPNKLEFPLTVDNKKDPMSS